MLLWRHPGLSGLVRSFSRYVTVRSWPSRFIGRSGSFLMWGTTERMMSSSAQVTIEPALRETPAASKRRRYSIVEKRRMVEESFQPGASVARVARAHGVNANQVFGWRRLYERGRLGGNTRTAQAAELLPVTISDAPAAPVPTP